MAVVPKGKKIVNDTTPMICTIEGIAKKEHVDYIMKVQRGINHDDSWQVVHRYSEFVTLQSILEVSGIDLSLPPKKVFGNMDATFIAERQQGLQNYINLILAHPILTRHIAVKRFLDPANYSWDFQEIAMQNVAMFLRSVPNWEIVEPLPDIGWRLRKQFFLIKPTDPTKKDIRNILTWTDYGPEFCLDEKDLEAILKLMTSSQHPYICPPSFTTINSEGVIIVRNFMPNGTLRDCLCKAKPKLNQLKKYGNPKSRAVLHEQNIQLFGRQILEALKFLHEKGIPYGHLHTGNIVLEGNVCRLLEIENGLMGIPSIHRHRYVPMKKIQEKEAEDVYCFAHVLYEMAFGDALRSSTLHDVPPNCPSQLSKCALTLISSKLKEAIKTAKERAETKLKEDQKMLRQFRRASKAHAHHMSEEEKKKRKKSAKKISSKLKEAIKTAKERAETKLKEDQKMLRQFRRASKAHAHHMSEEEKKKRKKSAKKLQKEASLSDTTQPSAAARPPSSPAPVSPRTPTSGSSSIPPAPQAPAPPPAPSSQAPAKKTSPPPKSQERGALLNSICDFRKGGLKKTVTNDKSKPSI
ncbi:PX domain-containing protein kinase-like protein [Orbicella faveolata]|uniref:PX domain-containing protein kinase-like protein n=1 Tax=Orbicella faveolata TaxID=48498 RepID=UPI0009E39FAD|nr:PX domain-containing protein kinase-like protein [Orbicella faveolata]